MKLDSLHLNFKDYNTVVMAAINLASGSENEQSGGVDTFYDLIDDFDLIVSSFASQYGIRLAELKSNAVE
mgnify:CR=1 FL=1